MMDDVLRQAIALSSGTIATLIDDSNMAAIDAAQAQFVEFVQARPNTFRNWQAAWLAFKHCTLVPLTTAVAGVQ